MTRIAGGLSGLGAGALTGHMVWQRGKHRTGARMGHGHPAFGAFTAWKAAPLYSAPVLHFFASLRLCVRRCQRTAEETSTTTMARFTK